MAIIKIKTIKNNLQKVINYAKNGDKTDKGILVSGVNCTTENAYEDMAQIKRFFHKEGKTLGYHIIQSFKGNEIKPEDANKIGNQLAEEMWGDKYQVVICTHINKANIHNHIILNSVSFVDGKKYHNSKANIAFVKEISDRICLKNGLSFIMTRRGDREKEFREKNIDYFNRTDEKMQKVINDIDEAIKSVKKYSDFKLMLQAKGYSDIDNSRKYLSIKTPYFNRKVRINRGFGDDYSVDGIKERIYGYRKDRTIPFANYNKKYYKKIYIGPKINKFLLNTSSLYRLYVHYLYKFKILPSKNEYVELSTEDYKQKRRINMVFEELNFLSKHRFDKIKQIEEYKTNIEGKLPELKGERENLWIKFKKANYSEEKDYIKNRIDNITNEIDILNGQKNACKRIIETYKEACKEVAMERVEKEKEIVLRNDKNKRIRNK